MTGLAEFLTIGRRFIPMQLGHGKPTCIHYGSNGGQFFIDEDTYWHDERRQACHNLLREGRLDITRTLADRS